MIFVLVFIASLSAESTADWREKYSYSLLTPDYGVLSEDDLYAELWFNDITDPNDKRAKNVVGDWICFPEKQIRMKSNSWWLDQGGLGYADNGLHCDVNFEGELGGRVYTFSDRRGHPMVFCRELIRTWKKIKATGTHICMNSISLDDAYLGPLPINRTWNKFKGKDGCDSYFEFGCDVKNWEKEAPWQDIPILNAEKKYLKYPGHPK